MEEDEIIARIGSELEDILLLKGVSQEHIKYIKQEKMNQLNLDDIYDYSYDIDGVQLVDVKKIQGGSRFKSGMETVFQLASNSALRGDALLNELRMANALTHIKEDSLKQLREWYTERCSPVNLIWYKDLDIYRVGGDGTHRSLYAKTVGVPAIRAEVSVYIKNEHKERYYSYRNKLIDEFNIESLPDEYARHYDEGNLKIDIDGISMQIRGYEVPRREDFDSLLVFEVQLRQDFSFLHHPRFGTIVQKDGIIMALFGWDYIAEKAGKGCRNRLKQYVRQMTQ